jgi:hypothetical protein
VRHDLTLGSAMIVELQMRKREMGCRSEQCGGLRDDIQN